MNAPFSNFRNKLVHLKDFSALLIFGIALFFIFHFHIRNMVLPSAFFGFFLLLSGSVCVQFRNNIRDNFGTISGTILGEFLDNFNDNFGTI